MTKGENTEAALLELECKLLEQEHRVLPALKSFFNRNKWSRTDPRRAASTFGLAMALFHGLGRTAGWGGALAAGLGIYQLVLLWNQNEEMARQTAKMEAQHITLQEQVHDQIQANTNADLARYIDRSERLLDTLYARAEDCPESARQCYWRRVTDYCLPELKVCPSVHPYAIRIQAFQELLDLDAAYGVKRSFEGLDLPLLYFRSLSLEDSNAPTEPAASRGRGFVCKVCRLLDGRFYDQDLTAAYIHYSDLGGSDFSRSNLTSATFHQVYLAEVKFDGADLTNAELCETRRLTSKQVATAKSLNGTKLDARLLTEDLEARGAVECKPSLDVE